MLRKSIELFTMREYQRNAQQIIGREGETATLFGRCLLSLNLRVGGFAPRHLSRWAAFQY